MLDRTTNLPVGDSRKRDPTGTSGIRAAFRAAGKLRLRQLRAAVRVAVVDNDLLGLSQDSSMRYHAPATRLAAFGSYLESEATRLLCSDWFAPHLERAWQSGIHSAAREMQSLVLPSYGHDKLLELTRREISGIIAALVQQVTRAASRLLTRRGHKFRAWRTLLPPFDAVGELRVALLADTMTVAAHNEAKLEIYRQFGVQRVGVNPEWLPPKRRRRVGDAFDPGEQRDPQGRWAGGYTGTEAGPKMVQAGLIANNFLPRSAVVSKSDADQLFAAGVFRSSPRQMTFSASELRTVQDYLVPSQVAEYQKPRSERAFGLSTEHIAVVRVGSETVVVDGTHRLAAAVLNGQKLVSVNHFGEWRRSGSTWEKVSVARDADLVGVKTAEDDRVCVACEDYAAGAPYELEDVEGVLPLHPRCRCEWRPWLDIVEDADWEEQKHPRGFGGKFGSGGGQSKFAQALGEHQKMQSAPESEQTRRVPAAYGLTTMAINAAADKVDETYDKVMHESRDREFSKSELRSMKSYQSSGAAERINKGLRDGKLAEKDATIVANLDMMIASSTLKEDHVLFRGVSAKGIDTLTSLQPGNLLTSKGFTSTSLHPDIAVGFAQGKGNKNVGDMHVMRVLAPKGTHALLAPERQAAVSEKEYESILPRDIVLRHVGKSSEKRGDSNITYYDFEIHSGQSKSDELPEFDPAKHPRGTHGHFVQSGELDLPSMVKVEEQKGSNPGGVYVLQGDYGTSKKFYVKQGKSQRHVANELLAADLMKLAGARTLAYRPVEGGLHVATEWQKLSKTSATQLSTEERAVARKDFAVHAWLANWDALGIDNSNLGTDEHGRPVWLDLGGALEYRAQGAPKGEKFGNKVDEWESMRSGYLNKTAVALFGGMSQAELAESGKKVYAVTPEQIREAVKARGLPTELANKLIVRRFDVISRGATAAAAAAHEHAQAPPSVLTSVITPPAPPTQSEKEAQHAAAIKTVLSVKLKGNSTERVAMRKLLVNPMTSISQANELKASILQSFNQHHAKLLKKGQMEKAGELQAKINKYAEKYGLPQYKIVPKTNAEANVGFSSQTITESKAVMKSEGGTYSPEEVKAFNDLVAVSSENHAKMYLYKAKEKVKNVGYLSYPEAAHIVAYSGQAYRETNKRLRENNMTTAFWNHVNALNDALSKLPNHVGTVWRKTDLPADVFAKFKVGDVVQERQFMSTSKSSHVVWSGKYRFEIQSKTGKDISKLSSHPGEQEVLFRTGSQFRITSVVANQVKMEEV